MSSIVILFSCVIRRFRSLRGQGIYYDGFRVTQYHFLGLQKNQQGWQTSALAMHGSGAHRRDQTPIAWELRCQMGWDVPLLTLGGLGRGCAPSPTPTPPPPPQKICWEFYDGFRVTWCDITALESTQQEADTRVMRHAIYSVHNEGVDHDNDTDNYHRHLSVISSWTVCTCAFNCQRPWMTLNWPPVALMRSVTFVFRVYHKNLNEDWSTLLAVEM